MSNSQPTNHKLIKLQYSTVNFNISNSININNKNPSNIKGKIATQSRNLSSTLNNNPTLTNTILKENKNQRQLSKENIPGNNKTIANMVINSKSITKNKELNKELNNENNYLSKKLNSALAQLSIIPKPLQIKKNNKENTDDKETKGHFHSNSNSTSNFNNFLNKLNRIKLKNSSITNLKDEVNPENKEIKEKITNHGYTESLESLGSKGSIGLKILKTKTKIAILNNRTNNGNNLTNFYKESNLKIDKKENNTNCKSSGKIISRNSKYSLKDILSSSYSNFKHRKKEILSRKGSLANSKEKNNSNSIPNNEHDHDHNYISQLNNDNLNITKKEFLSHLNSINNSIRQTESRMSNANNSNINILEESLEDKIIKSQQVNKDECEFDISGKLKNIELLNTDEIDEARKNEKNQKKYFFNHDYKKKYKQAKLDIEELKQQIKNLNKSNSEFNQRLKLKQSEINDNMQVNEILKLYITNLQTESIYKIKDLNKKLEEKDNIIDKLKNISLFFNKSNDTTSEKFNNMLYVCKLFEKELMTMNKEQGRNFEKIITENEYLRKVVASSQITQIGLSNCHISKINNISISNNVNKQDEISKVLNKKLVSNYHRKKNTEIFNDTIKDDKLDKSNEKDYSKTSSLQDDLKDLEKNDVKQEINKYTESTGVSQTKPKNSQIYLFYKTPRQTNSRSSN